MSPHDEGWINQSAGVQALLTLVKIVSQSEAKSPPIIIRQHR